MTTPNDSEICTRVASLLQVDVARCTAATPLTTLVSDSFRLVEMAIDIQEDYDIILGQDDMRALVTLGDLAAMVRRRMS